MKKGAHCPKQHGYSDTRCLAKLKRGKGILAMEKAKKTPAEWAQKFDPLFKVKGKARHLARNAHDFWAILDAKGGE